MTEIPDSQVFGDHSLHAGFFDFSEIPERDLKIDLHTHCYFFWWRLKIVVPLAV
jgi:hypothetical protein